MLLGSYQSESGETYKVIGQITAYYDDILYSEKHDAYYNSDTGDWLEQKCDDPNCEFCPNMPDNAIKENEK